MKLPGIFKTLVWIGMCTAAVGLLCAQAPPPGAPGDPGYGQAPDANMDPPSRVARLNYINGTVSLRPDSVPDWAPATPNFPLTSGYHLWTDQGSHAELHIGATALRLADETALAVLNLDDRVAQFSLTQGALNVRVAMMNPGDVIEVDSPNGAATLLAPGSYRFDVNADGTMTVVTVRAGQAEVTSGGQAVPVQAMQRAHFSGADQSDPELTGAPGPDPWDQWCFGRDAGEDRAVQASARYVPPDMNGAADLGAYGTWQTDPIYGGVWEPSGMPPGWAPYRFGHWAYIAPWGWTWIDDAPWGFAPFHYGRWVMIGGGWGWVPGRIGPRPVYAPALVAFVGGRGFSLGIGVGGVGMAAWVPLGPYEAFHPGYRVSAAYVANINVAHVTNINVRNATYVNRSYVTAVPQAAFVGARPVATAAVRVPAEAIGRMQAVEMSSIRPGREALAGSAIQSGARVATPPPAVVSRSIVARTPLPATARTSGPVRMVPGMPSNVPGNAGGARPAYASPGRPMMNDRPPSARQGQPQTGGPPVAGNAPQSINRPQASGFQPAQQHSLQQVQQRPTQAAPPHASPVVVPQRTPPKSNEKRPRVTEKKERP